MYLLTTAKDGWKKTSHPRKREREREREDIPIFLSFVVRKKNFSLLTHSRRMDVTDTRKRTIFAAAAAKFKRIRSKSFFSVFL